MAKTTTEQGQKLTERQERFCIAYALSGNAAKSAREAGYEEDVAKQQGWENLTKPYLVARINEIRRQYELNGQISGEWVIAKLKEIVERTTQAVPVLDREGNETGQWRFDSRGANKALELLGKTIALYVERRDTEIKGEFPVKVVAVEGFKGWKDASDVDNCLQTNGDSEA